MKRRHSTLRFVDLFAGIGSFHRAARRVLPDARCVLAVEWDAACQAVYAQAFPTTTLRGDVRKITRAILKNGKERDATITEIRKRVPAHDILFAGFPCQPFSKGGHQLGLSEKTQGTLFHDIVRIIDARRPRVVLLENVPNIVHHDEGRTWTTIVQILRGLDYSVDSDPLVLSPHHLKVRSGGAPQNRPRVYIVAVDRRRGLTSPHNAELVTAADRRRSTSRWRIASILHSTSLHGLAVEPRQRAWLEAWDEFVRLVPADSLPGFPIWVDAWYGKMSAPVQRAGSGSILRSKRNGEHSSELGWWAEFVAKNRAFHSKYRSVLDPWVKRHDVLSFPDSRRKFEWQAREVHPTRNGRTIRDLLVQLRPSGIRVKPPTYAPALVAAAQTPLVGNGRTWRPIGPAEAALLQGITDFSPWRRAMKQGQGVTQQVAYRQLGNAVNVGVAALVLRRTLEVTMPAVLRAHDHRAPGEPVARPRARHARREH